MKNTNVYHITYCAKLKMASLYFNGCNFRCLGCIRKKCRYDIHLSSSERKKDRKLSIKAIMEALRNKEVKRTIFMGGEPSMDPMLTPLCKELKAELRTDNVLLTNGYALPVLNCIDEVCVGIKAYSSELHKEYTGKDAQTVFKNLSELNKEKIIFRTETMFIPDYIDQREIALIARAISRINPGIPLRIDAYIPVPGMNWRSPTEKEMEQVLLVAQEYLHEVTFIRRGAKPEKTVTMV